MLRAAVDRRWSASSARPAAARSRAGQELPDADVRFWSAPGYQQIAHMPSILEVNSRRPRCLQCGCLADVVEVQDLEDRRELARMRASDEFLRFIPRIREITGCGVAEAKATYLHLAKIDRQCHRCSARLEPGDVVDCPKCRSLNLIW